MPYLLPFLVFFSGVVLNSHAQIDKGSLWVEDNFEVDIRQEAGGKTRFGLEISPRATYFWSERWGAGGSFQLGLNEPFLEVGQALWVRHNFFRSSPLVLYTQLAWQRNELFLDNGTQYLLMFRRQGFMIDLGGEYFFYPNISLFLNYSKSIYESFKQSSIVEAQTGPGIFRMGLRAFFHSGEYEAQRRRSGKDELIGNWQQGNFLLGGGLQVSEADPLRPNTNDEVSLTAAGGFFLRDRLALVLAPTLYYTNDFIILRASLSGGVRYHLPISMWEYFYAGIGGLFALESRKRSGPPDFILNRWEGTLEAGLGITSRPGLTFEIGGMYVPTFQPIKSIGSRMAFRAGFRYFIRK
jgi:hypothetical protein